MTILVKLHMKAPLHVGSSTLGEEDTYDYVPSDTLFSGLCHAYLELFGTQALEELLGIFEERPPFAISSAFPFSGHTLYVPFPRVSLTARAEGPERGAKKRLKEVPWIPLQSFSGLLRYGDVHEAPTPAEEELPQKELLPRVTLDRDTSGSALYYVRRARFPPGGGLWFLLDVRDEALEGALSAALHLLGDMGVGGERGAWAADGSLPNSVPLPNYWTSTSGRAPPMSPFPGCTRGRVRSGSSIATPW